MSIITLKDKGYKGERKFKMNYRKESNGHGWIKERKGEARESSTLDLTKT